MFRLIYLMLYFQNFLLSNMFDHQQFIINDVKPEIASPPINEFIFYLRKSMFEYRGETSELDENHSQVLRYEAKRTCYLPGEQVRGGTGRTYVGQRYLG